MGLEALELQATHYRRPWYWLAVLLAAALAISVLLVVAARSRMAQNEREFDSLQMLRLQRAALRIEEFLGDAAQLDEAAADTLGPLRGDRALVESLLHGLVRSRANPAIYGIGIFYAPNVFDRSSRLFGPYYVNAAGRPIKLIVNTERNFVYTSLAWYAAAQEGRGRIVIIGPYTEEAQSYISLLEAFYQDGQLAGVVSVDTRTQAFERIVTSALDPSDVAYITNAKGERHVTMGTPDAKQRIDRSLPLVYPHDNLQLSAILRVSADAAPLQRQNRRVETETLLELLGVWFVAALFGAVILRAWRSRERNLALELSQARMEREIAVGKQIQEELRKAAYTDALTGLPSRTPFMERVAAAIEAYAGGTPCAIFFIDLDRFNLVNETLGHTVGDQMLVAVAKRLRDDLPQAMVARLGGDEFVVVASIGHDDAAALARRLLDSLREPVTAGDRSLYSAASIGVVIVDGTYQRPDELLRDADIAMYAAKRLGRDCFVVFDAAMRRRVSSESELENDLRHAVERREFVPYYQPIVKIAGGETAAFEALVRWRRPAYGIVTPGSFIAFAETRGLVDTIDDFMLDAVCTDVPAILNAYPSATISVNVSAAHLAQPDLAESIARVMHERGVAPERLKIEITETAVMSNHAHARATLQRLRDAGLQVVLDDFGQGHSSLAYLQRLPISGLKIDRAFVEPLGGDAAALAIARSIVAMAATLGLYTVGEGVETQQQLEALRELGVDYAQGFLFAQPLDVEAVLRFSPTASAGR